MRFFFLVFVLIIFYSPISYAVYKCLDSAGRVSYQSESCKFDQVKEMNVNGLVGGAYLKKVVFNIKGRAYGKTYSIEVGHPKAWVNIYSMTEAERVSIGYTGFHNLEDAHKSKNPIFYAASKSSRTRIDLRFEPDVFYTRKGDGYVSQKKKNIISKKEISKYLNPFERLYKYKRKDLYEDVQASEVVLENGIGRVLYAKSRKGRYRHIRHAVVVFNSGLMIKLKVLSDQKVSKDYNAALDMLKKHIKLL